MGAVRAGQVDCQWWGAGWGHGEESDGWGERVRWFRRCARCGWLAGEGGAAGGGGAAPGGAAPGGGGVAGGPVVGGGAGGWGGGGGGRGEGRVPPREPQGGGELEPDGDY